MRGPVCCPARLRMRVYGPSTTRATTACSLRRLPSPLDASDLAAALKIARARELAIRIRAGGHSYIGASTVAGGVVLDLRRLRGIRLPARRQRAGGRRPASDRADRGARAARAGCGARLVPDGRRGGIHAGRRLRVRGAALRPGLRHAPRRARGRPAHAEARAGGRGTAARPARSRREPGARHIAATSHASRRSRHDVLRRLPVVARGGDRGAPSRPAAHPRPPRSRPSAPSRPEPARPRSRSSGSTSAPGRPRTGRSRGCWSPARRCRRTRTPTCRRS